MRAEYEVGSRIRSQENSAGAGKGKTHTVAKVRSQQHELKRPSQSRGELPCIQPGGWSLITQPHGQARYCPSLRLPHYIRKVLWAGLPSDSR